MKKNIFWVTGLLCLLGCTDKHEDVYDPDFAIKQYESDWKTQIGDIDPEQTWNMAVSRSAKVTLKEDALSDYRIQLFTANPLSNPEAMLLASYKLTTDASGVGSISFKFDLPQRTQSLYAVRMDSHNRRLVQLVEVPSSETIQIDFGRTTSRSVSRGVNDLYQIPEYESPYADETSVNTEINNGYVKISNYKSEFWKHMSASKIAWCLSDTQDLPYFYYDSHQQLTSFLIVIENGGVLNFNQNNIYTIPQIEKFDIIVKSGGELKMNNQGALGNVRLMVLPGGKVTGHTLKTGLAQETVTSVDGIYNAGTINVQNLYMMNGNIYNGNIMNIGELHAPNGGTFVNNGKVSCEKAGVSGNQALILKTNCLFRCGERLKCNEIWIGSNAAVEVPTIEIYGALYLNKNSIVRAEEASMGNTAINAPAQTDNYALISFKKLVNYFTNNDGSSAPISGNLYFEYGQITGNGSEHWENRIDYLANQANNNGGQCCVTGIGEADIVIPGSDVTNIEDAECTGSGNTPSGDIPPTPSLAAMTWTLAYEDLGGIGDFDFNDVVLRVSHASGETTANITLCAAGGTLDTHVYYGTLDLGEVHQKFGVSTSVMVNTGSGADRDMVELGPVTVDEGFSLSSNGDKFKIRVTKEDNTTTNEISLPSQEGVAPQVICIEGKWAWPIERTPIDVAYKNFGKWGSNYESDTNWHITSSGSVIRK